MKLTGENQSTRGETCPSAALATTNPTWTHPGFFYIFPLIHFVLLYPPVLLHVTYVLIHIIFGTGSNTGLRGERPATNCLSHGTASPRDVVTIGRRRT
jgi:hypothetical protein